MLSKGKQPLYKFPLNFRFCWSKKKLKQKSRKISNFGKVLNSLSHSNKKNLWLVIWNSNWIEQLLGNGRKWIINMILFFFQNDNITICFCLLPSSDVWTEHDQKTCLFTWKRGGKFEFQVEWIFEFEKMDYENLILATNFAWRLKSEKRKYCKWLFISSRIMHSIRK